ncbi:sulfite exporter TauE/SafE family protein [Ectobacillus sp. sgz5001026]|uniref:sulfite exporter TauE/SafE family protein n=1 Tax=Ectobacillus sp. sgz5001026 TaxID=3242473 RepID=UPI0036D3FAC5
MSIGFVLLIFVLGFVGSFLSGMLGIGGAIINFPILLYVPALLGFSSFSAHEVAGIVAVQVFFSTLSGAWYYRKSEYVNKALVLYMGSSILIGSYIGSYGSKLISEAQINILYAVLATIAAIMMFVPRKGLDDVSLQKVTFNRWIAVISSFIVGSVSGIVGAGGAFILVPIMLVILKVPTRMTIASSLVITFISSIGATTGKLMTGQIVWIPAAIMVIASILASPLGAKMSKKVSAKMLQGILAALILATSLKIWIGML